MSAHHGQRWETADPDIRAFVDEVVAAVRRSPGAGLAGAYLHGSLAMGCFRRAHSDLDLLFVVGSGGLTIDQRARLAKDFVRLSDRRPILGDLELSVLNEDQAKAFRHPSRFELHYSADWKELIRRDEVNYGADHVDPDLTAHITVARARGIALYGPPPQERFAPVPWRDYLAAVRDDFDWIVEGQNLHETPIYGTLNICRTLQLLAGGEGTIASKEEGGMWGLAHVPAEHRPLVEQALALYRSAEPVTEALRRTRGAHWDPAALSAFQRWARTVADR